MHRAEPPRLCRVEQIMGMPIEVDIRDADASAHVVDELFAWFREVDRRFSTYRPESEISRLNAGLVSVDGLTEETGEVMDQCETQRERTRGYFNCAGLPLPVPLTSPAGETVTHGFDPSGYVKGWAVDRGAELLFEFGLLNFCVNAGGDVRTAGGALPEATWRVGIRHPIAHDKLAAAVTGSGIAVATSAEYERGRHIVDPHTGRPPEGVLSVTIVGSDLATADALATAAFAMGVEGPRWILNQPGFEAMIIMADETVYLTPEFPRVID
jgi:thiamine biosynthesis lipoprotein